MEMALLETFQRFMELDIVGILEPAPQQAKKTMRNLFRFSKNMIARFVQVQTIAVFKTGWAGWVADHCFFWHNIACYTLVPSTIAISLSVNP